MTLPQLGILERPGMLARHNVSLLHPVISATFSLFCFFQEKQFSTTETIKYEINICLNLHFSISRYFSPTFIVI